MTRAVSHFAPSRSLNLGMYLIRAHPDPALPRSGFEAEKQTPENYRLMSLPYVGCCVMQSLAPARHNPEPNNFGSPVVCRKQALGATRAPPSLGPARTT